MQRWRPSKSATFGRIGLVVPARRPLSAAVIVTQMAGFKVPPLAA
ncbi:hypothetical protein [Sphingopyxis sp. Root154]|nr:hypothetical protein [Sphingopyxis sp. Root154]